MTLFYVISSLASLCGFAYFMYYRGWKKGINCGEKVAKKELAHRLDKSKEAIEMAQTEVKECTAKIEKLKQDAIKIPKIKDKTKRKQAEDEYQSQLHRLAGLGAQQGLAEAMGRQQAGLGIGGSPFTQDMMRSLHGLFPPWPFNQ